MIIFLNRHFKMLAQRDTRVETAIFPSGPGISDLQLKYSQSVSYSPLLFCFSKFEYDFYLRRQCYSRPIHHPVYSNTSRTCPWRPWRSPESPHSGANAATHSCVCSHGRSTYRSKATMFIPSPSWPLHNVESDFQLKETWSFSGGEECSKGFLPGRVLSSWFRKWRMIDGPVLGVFTQR